VEFFAAFSLFAPAEITETILDIAYSSDRFVVGFVELCKLYRYCRFDCSVPRSSSLVTVK